MNYYGRRRLSVCQSDGMANTTEKLCHLIGRKTVNKGFQILKCARLIPHNFDVFLSKLPEIPYKNVLI